MRWSFRGGRCEGHVNLEDLLDVFSEQVVDMGHLTVDPGVEDSVAASHHGPGIRAPGESQARPEVVVVLGKPRLSEEFVTQSESQQEAPVDTP